MNKKKIKIAISGAFGKMGKCLIKESKKFNKIDLSLLIIRKKEKKKNNIYKKYIKNNNIIKNSIKNNKNFDILIDFTTPKNTMKNLDFCYKNNKKIIIGTTGLSKKIILILKKIKKISILYSSNFSIGINLMLKLLKITTKKIGKISDIEISEAHHRHKIDSPSGTALTLGKKIAKNMNWDFNKVSVLNRNKKIIKEKKEIGFTSIRAGEIIGNHSVIFAGLGETLTIKHQAFNRKTFAQGAIKAAIWIKNKKNGLFNMEDVLKK